MGSEIFFDFQMGKIIIKMIFIFIYKSINYVYIEYYF